MLRKITGIVFVSLSAAIFMAGPAIAADDLMEQALAKIDAESEQGWAYTRTIRINAEDEVIVVVERYDPSKPPGERSTILEVFNKNDPDADADNYDGDVNIDMPLYSELRDYTEAGVELISENDTEAVYSVLRDENGDRRFGGVSINAGDIPDSLSGSLTVTKTSPDAPYVSTVRLGLDVEKDGFLFAIDSFELVYHFAPGPDEKTMLLKDFYFNLDMTFLVFFDLEVEIEAEISDYEYVGIYEKD